MKETPSWIVNREHAHRLQKRFTFKDFKAAMQFVNNVAALAEQEGHHPDICISYNKVDFK